MNKSTFACLLLSACGAQITQGESLAPDRTTRSISRSPSPYTTAAQQPTVSVPLSAQAVPAATMVPATQGRMRVEASAYKQRRFGVSDVDHAQLMELCADGDGCEISLGMANHVIEGVRIPLHMGVPCRVAMTPPDNGRVNWAVGDGCAVLRSVHHGSPVSSYWGDEFGVDGLDESGLGRVLAYYACHFTDTKPDPNSSTMGLLADNETGFYLVAAPPEWSSANEPNPYPSVWTWTDSTPPAYKCVMLVDD